MMKKYLSIAFTLLLAGCNPYSATQSPLYQYHSTARLARNQYKISALRYTSLRDTALSTGARAGLAWRSKEINCILRRFERPLDLIYNFTPLLLDKNVLPPVLMEARYTLDQTAEDIIRVSDRAYAIQSQARFVTMPPTWREYLLSNYKDPGLPDGTLLPRNATEKEVWDRYIDEGWQIGITQADVIFTENLARLKRDYEGMVLYQSLLAQNMVSLPFVAEVNLGVTGGPNEMAINDRILRITALPEFNTHSKEWESQMVFDDKMR
jgi:defect-in-organelle-trafficking protein DotC